MIKFLDLQKINSQYKEDLIRASQEVIENGWYLLGEKINNFEKKLGDYLGVKHVITCANGLDALRIILKAYIYRGLLKEGDEIIVPANTYIATILAITDNRLKPVFVDPDISNYNLDITKIEEQITEKTKAIIVVHLYGRICWSEKLEGIAKNNNLLLIEDNAQAIGARMDNLKLSGNLGDAAGFSFYPGKNLGALGDSGAIATNDSNIAEIARSIANYGSCRKYYNEYCGLNSRMDEIQAAFLSVKMDHLDNENNIRSELAGLYIRGIHNPEIILPEMSSPDDRNNVWHLFVIRTTARDKLQNYLSSNGIQTLIHYPVPAHKQKCYPQYNSLTLTVTELLAEQVLSLPLSPVLTKSEVDFVIEKINDWGQ